MHMGSKQFVLATLLLSDLKLGQMLQLLFSLYQMYFPASLTLLLVTQA